MIKIIHQCWFGPNPMPEEHVEYGRKWKELNPDWEFIVWTENSLPALVNKDVYDELGIPLSINHRIHPIALATQRADVVAYELVYSYGGLYINTDIEPVKPLTKLFEDNPELLTKCGAGWEVPDQWVVNAVLWAPEPFMPFWRICINDLSGRYFSDRGGYMNGVTGPHLITAAYRKKPGLLHVFPKETFNPYGFLDVPVGGVLSYNPDELPARTVGVHKWAHRTNGRPQTASVLKEDQ